MTLANFIFVVFLLLSFGVFAFLFMLMRQIKIQRSLSADKMKTLSLLLYAPALLIFILVFISITHWRTDIQDAQQRAALESFISGVYPPLFKTQASLRTDLIHMQSLVNKLKKIEPDHPNQRDLLRTIKQQYSKGHLALYDAYNKSDKDVRRAWIAHNTLDSQDVLLKFSQQAPEIEKQIKRAQKDYQKQLYNVQNDMVRALDNARKLLSFMQKPTTPKRQQIINQLTTANLHPLNPHVETTLLHFLSTINTELSTDIKFIHTLVRLSTQQKVSLESHLRENPDLEKPLTKIMRDWKEFAAKERRYLQYIYYALETEYVVTMFNLPENSETINAMHQTLLKVVPTIKDQGLAAKRSIDQSYSFKLNN